MSDPHEPRAPRPGPFPLGRAALVLAVVHIVALSAFAVAQTITLSPQLSGQRDLMATMMTVMPVLQSMTILLAIATLIVGAIALGRRDQPRTGAALAVGSAGTALIIHLVTAVGIVLAQVLSGFH